MIEQRVITAENDYRDLDAWISRVGAKKILIVSSGSALYLGAFQRHLDELAKNGVDFVRFSDFKPNPRYESVEEGVRLLRKEACDAVIAVGGGSAMDVGKCIKLYAAMNPSRNYLQQEIIPNDIPLLAVPTTAGSGSEATRYAVIYYKGEKQSVTSEYCMPETVLLDPAPLKTLPPYQKKATMMDAFSHGIESFWSVNSTEESKAYSKDAISGVLKNMEGYLTNTEAGNAGMMRAAHTAGRAINITQTTAGHAMCYKITSLFGVAHGHAAILCNRVLFPWMIRNAGLCTDPRGERYLRSVFADIAAAMGCDTAEAGAEKMQWIFSRLELETPSANERQFRELRQSVNPVRLKNHPVRLDADAIDALYHDILRRQDES